MRAIDAGGERSGNQGLCLHLRRKKEGRLMKHRVDGTWKVESKPRKDETNGPVVGDRMEGCST